MTDPRNAAAAARRKKITVSWNRSLTLAWFSASVLQRCKRDHPSYTVYRCSQFSESHISSVIQHGVFLKSVIIVRWTYSEPESTMGILIAKSNRGRLVPGDRSRKLVGQEGGSKKASRR